MTSKIALTLLALGLGAKVFGCKCDGSRTLKESYRGHSVIIHGRVVSRTLIPFEWTMNPAKIDYVRNKLKDNKENLQSFQSDSVYEIRLLINESFKGRRAGDTLTIYTRTSSCGFPFRLNSEYIVYALEKSWHYHDDLTQSEGEDKFEKENTYWAHRCTRTMEYASEEALGLRLLRDKRE